MMLTRQPIRAPRLGAVAAPCRPAGLPSLMPIRPRHAVIRRFKEDDKEAELEARKAREEVIRKQEEALKQAEVAASKTGDQLKDQLKQDVGRVVETVDRSSAGKGYSSAVRVPWYVPAFTRRREVFIGRLAMVGFLATCALEIWGPGHPGPIAQVQLWSGLQHDSVLAVFTAIAAYNLIAGLGPWSPTFSPENLRDVARRPEGPPAKFVNPLNIGKLLGVSGWGFTKRNEVFHGRLAMLGFAAAVINEINTGLGPLGQVASYLGVPPDNVWYAACLNGFLLFTALMLGVSIFFPSRLQGSAAAEDDIY